MRVSSSTPSGYLLCDGTQYNNSIYPNLVAVIGTTYGGSSGTTFNVPNFQGMFLRGYGGSGNYISEALGVQQGDATLPPRNQGYRNIDSGGGGTSREVRARGEISTDPLDTGTAQTTSFARTANEVRPINYAVYYYIKY